MLQDSLAATEICLLSVAETCGSSRDKNLLNSSTLTRTKTNPSITATIFL